MQKRIQWEGGEQQALMAWFRLQHKDKLLASIPNHLVRSCVQARTQALSGLVSGMPDLMLFEARGLFHGLLIEMKRQVIKGQPKPVVSKNQQVIMEHLNAKGYKAVVANGFEEAKIEIENYLGLKNESKAGA